MCRYRVIEIENCEPLKIGSRGYQSTYSEPTTDHIPGSTIRGALIREMIRLGLFDDTTKNDILLKMECYNAYPFYNKTTYIPKAFHLRMNKHEWREKKIKENEEPLTLCNLLEEDETAKNPLSYSFIAIKDNKIFGKNVDKEYRLHHFTYSLNPENKEQENIFRYEAISSGQSFKGIIRYDEELENKMETLFEKKFAAYLGGSKGSGYGKCQICAEESMDNFIDVKNNLGIDYEKENNTKEVVITCLSDCLFRDEFGQPVNYIPKSYFFNLVNKGIKLENQFIQTGQTEGYNTTWKARYPKETTIKAGSVFKYIFKEDLTENELSELIYFLEGSLLGSRTQDGYGWLGVNIKYPKKLNIVEDSQIKNNTDIKQDEILFDFSDPKISQVLNIISLGMDEAKKRWLNVIYSSIKNKEDTNEINGKIIISNKLNNSQLKKMESIINEFLEHEKITGENIILKRDYTNDRDYFSLNECNFTDICHFLNGKSKEEYKKLTVFAENKLKSRQGNLFYSKEKQQRRKEIFIAELIKNSLCIEHMKGERQ
ncbi:MAG TPA: hypothetical protein DC034_08305 [Clostridium sp.]|jgi:hypothetical protein|nr:hypothetical protein [Clostridium sp.]